MNETGIVRDSPPRVIAGSPLTLTERLLVTPALGGPSVHVEATFARDTGELLLYRVVRGASGLPWADLRALDAFTRGIVAAKSSERRTA